MSKVNIKTGHNSLKTYPIGTNTCAVNTQRHITHTLFINHVSICTSRTTLLVLALSPFEKKTSFPIHVVRKICVGLQWTGNLSDLLHSCTTLVAISESFHLHQSTRKSDTVLLGFFRVEYLIEANRTRPTKKRFSGHNSGANNYFTTKPVAFLLILNALSTILNDRSK